MLYAFSRDGAVPGSRWWRQVHPKFEAPVNAVWLVVLMCFILGVPSVHSYTAFAAITSVGVVGLYISYGELHLSGQHVINYCVRLGQLIGMVCCLHVPTALS
jgi:amino acid transporter